MAATKVMPAGEKAINVPKKTQSKITGFKVIKSSSTPKRRSKKYLQALQRPTPPPARRYTVRILENGLVDTQETPDYLVAATKRNARESPLLCLPQKLRDMIFAYAMGGNTIDIHLKDADKPTSRLSDSLYEGKIAHTGPKRAKPKSAFHLTEVCRQIYSDTATLGYALNTFTFKGETTSHGRYDGSDGALEGWCRERVPAQFNAITSIRPHWLDLLYYLNDSNLLSLKQLFPHLKQIRVASRVVNSEAQWPSLNDPMRKYLRQQAKARIADRIKKQEGEDVEAVFRD